MKTAVICLLVVACLAVIISAQERGDGSGRPSRGNGAGRGDGTGRGEGRGEGRGQGRGEGRGEGRGDGQRERPTQEERDARFESIIADLSAEDQDAARAHRARIQEIRDSVDSPRDLTEEQRQEIRAEREGLGELLSQLGLELPSRGSRGSRGN